mmetsp:Transcript_26503/g.85641  ORF Transcript_26503/g.85641 Transcript_26503/m.85641 type:complete len:201 (+) Transcript_26503:130-732(+)
MWKQILAPLLSPSSACGFPGKTAKPRRSYTRLQATARPRPRIPMGPTRLDLGGLPPYFFPSHSLVLPGRASTSTLYTLLKTEMELSFCAACSASEPPFTARSPRPEARVGRGVRTMHRSGARSSVAALAGRGASAAFSRDETRCRVTRQAHDQSSLTSLPSASIRCTKAVASACDLRPTSTAIACSSATTSRPMVVPPQM